MYLVKFVVSAFCVSHMLSVILLQERSMMSDDSETMEDTKEGSLAEVADDSCTLEYIEIVPLDRPSDDYHTSEFISPVVEVKPEDLMEMKQEPDDEDDNEDSHCYVKQEPADEDDNGDLHCYVKQEPTDDNGDSCCFSHPCFTIQVCPACN